MYNKIVAGMSVLCLSLWSITSVDAKIVVDISSMHSNNMEQTEGKYGMFSAFVKKGLTWLESEALEKLVAQQKEGMSATKKMISQVQAGTLNNYEELAKLAPKRKALVEKLEKYMEDPVAFRYMCMNHWDNLLAQLFADEVIVAKYKIILEKKHLDVLKKVYMKKWKAFEKTLHTAFHAQIDAKNIKLFSILRAIELIIEDIKKELKTPVVMVNEFWDFTQFAKKDLTSVQKTALLELIGERKGAQKKFKKMLTEAKEKWNFDEVFEIVQNKRAGCQARFTLYLDSTKKEAFEAHCKKMGEKLKAMYK